MGGHMKFTELLGDYLIARDELIRIEKESWNAKIFYAAETVYIEAKENLEAFIKKNLKLP